MLVIQLEISYRVIISGTQKTQESIEHEPQVCIINYFHYVIEQGENAHHMMKTVLSFELTSNSRTYMLH